MFQSYTGCLLPHHNYVGTQQADWWVFQSYTGCLLPHHIATPEQRSAFPCFNPTQDACSLTTSPRRNNHPLFRVSILHRMLAPSPRREVPSWRRICKGFNPTQDACSLTTPIVQALRCLYFSFQSYTGCLLPHHP